MEGSLSQQLERYRVIYGRLAMTIRFALLWGNMHLNPRLVVVVVVVVVGLCSGRQCG
jgi:hypothetical protein